MNPNSPEPAQRHWLTGYLQLALAIIVMCVVSVGVLIAASWTFDSGVVVLVFFGIMLAVLGGLSCASIIRPRSTMRMLGNMAFYTACVLLFEVGLAAVMVGLGASLVSRWVAVPLVALAGALTWVLSHWEKRRRS
jgi:hypothetical protein